MHRAWARICLAVGVWTVAEGLGARDASAEGVCISRDAEQALSVCPSGKVETTSGRKSGSSFKPPPPPKKRDEPTRPPESPAGVTAVQRRRFLASARSTQLLVKEVQGLVSLLASTPRSAPDRPGIIRRIAEDFVELEASAFRTKTEAKSKPDAVKANKTLEAARAEAIKHYTMLKDQYPKWCQSTGAKPSGCADEVLYYLAYEHEQANDLERARKTYLELIQSYPNSKYLPHAYLAFGELFFQEAQGDPSKWSLAEQSYKEVIKYPPPDNTMFGYAHYKLGYVYWNQGDHPMALTELKKAIEYGVSFPKLPNATQIAASARHDLIPIFALAGDPRKSFDFFKPLGGDAGSDTPKTFEMMADLGQAYMDTGHYKEGITLYQDLITRDPGPRRCSYQGSITLATMAMRSGAKDAIKAELDKQLATHAAFLAEGHPEKVKLACSNLTADLLAETAMAWHLEAVGSGGVRGTGDKHTMDLAAEIYEKVASTFTREQFAKFEFPRLVKEDWPTLSKIHYARADLLYANKDWARCGPAFDAVLKEDGRGPMAAEAAYAAAICYQNVYLAAHEGGKDRVTSGNLPGSTSRARPAPTPSDSERLRAKDLTASQNGMVGAFNRYVCYVKPAPGDREGQERMVEIEFALGRVYYESNHWEEAAIAFRNVAMNHADSDAGVFAAELYLECLNVMATRAAPARPACIDTMADGAPKLRELYCGSGRAAAGKGGRARADTEQCNTLERVERDLERLRAQNLVERGEFEAGALAYMGIWDRYGRVACESKMPACDRMDEILYDAAKAFQAAHLLAKSISVKKTLIDPRYGLQDKTVARKAVYEIGGNYQAIAVYDEAASYYERFAKENPSMEKAAEALRDATVLRLGSGDEATAIQDADLFNRNYAQKQPAQAAQVAFAIGAHYVEREDWEKARKRLSGAIRQIDRSATLDVQIQAHAMLARASERVTGPSSAAAEYDRVRAFFKEPQKTLERLDAIEGEPAEKVRRAGKALAAFGEATFFLAEQRRREVDAIRFPVYKGGGARDEVLRFVNIQVADWIKKKRPAIEAVEKAYLEILEIKPVPPMWAIAAGARVGQMWGKFVAEFRAAPIPKEWRQNGMSPYGLPWEEIRAAYYEALDNASEPQKKRAKSAYEGCLSYSVRYQHFDQHSRSCEVWLSKNYGAEYHQMDELRGSPSRVASGLAERPAPAVLRPRG